MSDDRFIQIPAQLRYPDEAAFEAGLAEYVALNYANEAHAFHASNGAASLFELQWRGPTGAPLHPRERAKFQLLALEIAKVVAQFENAKDRAAAARAAAKRAVALAKRLGCRFDPELEVTPA